MKGRFAPSPSGRMHLGNLFAALLAWLSARAAGGEMVLRMEDLDTARCKDVYARLLAEDLRWLGLTWEEGYGAGGPNGPYCQSERGALYAAAVETLAAQGLIYPCYCTRAERLAASAPHGGAEPAIYDCHCRTLSDGEREALAQQRPCALRVAVPAREITVHDRHMGDYTQHLARDCGDFIVRRADGLYAYQLAVVVDDGLMGVTEVARGADLLSSAPRQLWLYACLNLPPPEFRHIPLLLSPDGRRLSKRDKDLDMGILREHFRPETLVGYLAMLAGQQDKPEPVTSQELARYFVWDKVPRKDITLPAGRERFFNMQDCQDGATVIK
ncbi:MAG: tRNA glutamyl-Q(34) synthetase GluQRS [Oscillospiraceae bacterium]|nr:tRNA glutamyl-Q(34) synthetase GluQRS [Oscillospiraceae bacterium]